MEQKKNKKLGPVRKGAVVPFLIITIIIVGFNIFLLDKVVKNSIEFFGTKVNGAEVNVGSVVSSFKDLSVEVSNVQFTDAKNPNLNLFAIEKIRFQMMWDALLRAKFVIDESSIEGILTGSKRKSVGKVLSKEEKASNDKDAEPALTSEVLSNAKKEFEGNIFGDISALLSGTSSKDLAKNIEDELKSKKYYEELEKTIDQKEKELKSMLDSLPKEKEISQYDDRIKAIDWKGMKNIKNAPKILKEANDLQKEITGAIKKYDEAYNRVKDEVKFVESSIKKAESLVNEDVAALESKMSIPSLDATSIARILFGAELVSKLEQYNVYFEKAKEYMPPKKEKTVVVVKNPRGKGRDYQFGTPNSYPLFWLKKANISSDNEQTKLKGSLLNLTTDQNVVKAPTTFTLDGDLKDKEISNMKVKIVVDHRANIKDSMSLSIGSMPVRDRSFSKSDGVSFGMKEASLSSTIDAKIEGDIVSLGMNNKFSRINYDIDAKNKNVKEILQNVANDTKVVTVDALAKGQIDKLNFKISTNLADAIKNSLGKQLQAKINEAKAKLRSGVDEKLAGNKKQINDKITSLKSKYEGEINKNKNKLSGLTDSLKKNEKSNPLKNPLDSLKKKFKF